MLLILITVGLLLLGELIGMFKDNFLIFFNFPPFSWDKPFFFDGWFIISSYVISFREIQNVINKRIVINFLFFLLFTCPFLKDTVHIMERQALQTFLRVKTFIQSIEILHMRNNTILNIKTNTLIEKRLHIVSIQQSIDKNFLIVLLFFQIIYI